LFPHKALNPNLQKLIEGILLADPLDVPLKASLILAIVGIFLTAFIGYLIGLLIEHPIGPGGLPVFGLLLGILVATDILILGEALKSRK
jgi:formate-dependent nitrite reductase membrane component NrfD